jgi:hypothetical protein
MYSTVFAQITNLATPNLTGDGATFFGNFIPKIITILFLIGGLAFFFMFLIGAIRWITSGGDKGAVEGARSQITQALIGMLVMVSIWAIAKLLETVFGISLLNINLGALMQPAA